MANKLCKITLNVLDYSSKESGAFTYVGEVIEINKNTSFNLYRFYQTDAGTLSVSIDYSKEVIQIVEKNDNVNMHLFLELDKYQKCIYQFDPTKFISLETRLFEKSIEDGNIVLDYDLYDANDKNHEHPLTRNKVVIEVERGNPC